MEILRLFAGLFGIVISGTKEAFTPKRAQDQTFEHMADLHGLKGEQRARYLKEMGHSLYI